MKTIQDSKLRAGLFPRQPGWQANGRDRLPRVWLVDDDGTFRELLRSLLERKELVECDRGFASGELLLAALAREAPPHMILLDVHLRDRNGIDFILPIKALAPATCVHMLTTFFDPEHAARALQAGASGFLVKSDPFDAILAQIVSCPGRNAAPTHSGRVGSTIP